MRDLFAQNFAVPFSQTMHCGLHRCFAHAESRADLRGPEQERRDSAFSSLCARLDELLLPVLSDLVVDVA